MTELPISESELQKNNRKEPHSMESSNLTCTHCNKSYKKQVWLTKHLESCPKRPSVQVQPEPQPEPLPVQDQEVAVVSEIVVSPIDSAIHELMNDLICELENDESAVMVNIQVQSFDVPDKIRERVLNSLFKTGDKPTNGQIAGAFYHLGRQMKSKEIFTYDKRAILQKDKEFLNQIIKNVTETDISGCYPSMIMVNPRIPIEFKQFFQILINERAKHPKGSMENQILKFVANKTIGLLGSEKVQYCRNCFVHSQVMESSRNTIRSIDKFTQSEQTLCIYTDAIFSINLENGNEVKNRCISELGVNVDQEVFDLFYHSRFFNHYIAYNIAEDKLKVRGFKGRNKISDMFIRFHLHELLHEALKSFLKTGNQSFLTNYLFRVYDEVVKHIKDNDVAWLADFLIKGETIVVEGELKNVKDLEILDVNWILLLKMNTFADIGRLINLPENYFDFAKYDFVSGAINCAIQRYDEKEKEITFIRNQLIDLRKLSKQYLQKGVFHEIFNRQTRLFADIDFEYEGDSILAQMALESDLEIINKGVSSAFNQQLSPYICRYITNKKISLHIVYDLVVDLVYQRAVMKRISETLKNPEILDLQPYARNKSLRLPYCPKMLDDGKLDVTRTLIPDRDDIPLKKYFVTDVENYPIFSHTIHRGTMICYTQHSFDFAKCPQFVAMITKAGLKIKESSVDGDKFKLEVVNGSPLCVVCNVKHQQAQNLYATIKNNQIYVRCFQMARHPETAIPLICQHYQRIPDPIITDITVPNTEYQYISNHPSLKVFVPNTLFLVKSAMGTGKSQAINQIIQSMRKEMTVLYVSCRKSFTSKIVNDFGLQDYRNVEHIEPKEGLRIAVQLESLQRVKLSGWSFVILDEWCSLIDHATKSDKDLQLLYDVTKAGSSIFICDALLNTSMMTTLKAFINKKPIEIVNSYLPDANRKMEIIRSTIQLHDEEGWRFDPLHVADKIVEQWQKNDKKGVIGAFFSSNTSMLRTVNILKMVEGLRVRFYNGQNWLIEDAEKNIVHQDIKDQHFACVNDSWQDYDVICYTSCITVGVSFDLPQASHMFVILETCSRGMPSVVNFYQAFARLRKVNSYTVFVQGDLKRRGCLTDDVEQYICRVTSVTDTENLQFKACMASYKASLDKLGWCYLQFLLQQNGYDISNSCGAGCIVDVEDLSAPQEFLQVFDQHNGESDLSRIRRELLWVEKYLNPSTKDSALHDFENRRDNPEGPKSSLYRVKGAQIVIEALLGYEFSASHLAEFLRQVEQLDKLKRFSDGVIAELKRIHDIPHINRSASDLEFMSRFPDVSVLYTSSPLLDNKDEVCRILSVFVSNQTLPIPRSFDKLIEDRTYDLMRPFIYKNSNPTDFHLDAKSQADVILWASIKTSVHKFLKNINSSNYNLREQRSLFINEDGKVDHPLLTKAFEGIASQFQRCILYALGIVKETKSKMDKDGNSVWAFNYHLLENLHISIFPKQMTKEEEEAHLAAKAEKLKEKKKLRSEKAKLKRAAIKQAKQAESK